MLRQFVLCLLCYQFHACGIACPNGTDFAGRGAEYDMAKPEWW